MRFRLNLFHLVALMALLLIPSLMMFAQESEPVAFATATTSDTSSPVVIPSETESLSVSPVLSDSDEIPVETLSLFATLAGQMLERQQGASMTERNVTLVVIGIIVVCLGSWLYKSTPPGAIKDKIGNELLSTSGAVVNGLRPYAKLTPTDIDDNFLDYVYQRLEARRRVSEIKTELGQDIPRDRDSVG